MTGPTTVPHADDGRRRTWLERAQQLRRIALEVDDLTVRQEILEIAAKWAAMAERLSALPWSGIATEDPASARNDD
jgi:hypothetical protein